jgi:integrase
MTREQRQLFLTTAATYAPHYYYPLFMTLAGTGMMLGEALALQWDDVDLEAREIRVARSLSRGRVDTPKAGHGRTVCLSQSVAEMLRQFEQQRAAQMLEREWPMLPPWVFFTRAGTLWIRVKSGARCARCSGVRSCRSIFRPSRPGEKGGPDRGGRGRTRGHAAGA